MISRINKIKVDSTDTISDMCLYGTEYPTDKSPYSSTWHRHPYTAIYNLIFSNLRYKDIVFGEIGILDNMSMQMWRKFFTSATLYGFEYLDDKLEKAVSDKIPSTHYIKTDVSSKDELFKSLNSVGSMFDIIIDDSTHLFEHQINFVDVAVDFVKPGGMLIIEDVFRGWPDSRYEQALVDLNQYFSSIQSIEANHESSFSGGTSNEPYYDNDKIIVLHRNNVVRVRSNEEAAKNLSRIPKINS